MKLTFVALKLEPVIVLLNKIILTFEMKRIAIRVQHKSFIGIFLEQKIGNSCFVFCLCFS